MSYVNLNIPVEKKYQKSTKDKVFKKFDEYKRKVAENFILLKVQLFFYFKFEHGDSGSPTIDEYTCFYIIRSNNLNEILETQKELNITRLYEINQNCQNVFKNIKICWHNYKKTLKDRPIEDRPKAVYIPTSLLHDIFYKRNISKGRSYFIFKGKIPENDDARYFIGIS